MPRQRLPRKLPVNLLPIIIALVTIMALASMSACGSDDAAEENPQKETTAAATTDTITTPQGNLSITAVTVKPHENNPDLKWVLVDMESEDGTTASAAAIFDGVERTAIMIGFDGEEEKEAVSISQSGTAVQVGFIIPDTSGEYMLLWPDNEPIPLEGLAGN